MLENEIYQETAWYIAPATEKLLFHVERPKKWEAALETLGMNPAFLSLNQGES